MNHLDDTLLIDTPENITFGYEIAGIGSRFLAALIDTALILILQILVNFIILFVYTRGLQVDLESGLQSSFGWLMAALGLISFLLFWGYYILFEIFWNGRSPGKRLIKLRVIRADGMPISAAESVVRNLVRLVDFLPFYYGVGVITMFVNSQSRRLGDLAAGTIVVRENTTDVSLKSLAPPEINAARRIETAKGEPIRGDEYPVDRLGSQDFQLIEMYLNRRGALKNRTYLSMKIARALLAKMGIEKPYMAMTEAESLLEMILLVHRRRMNGEPERVVPITNEAPRIIEAASSAESTESAVYDPAPNAEPTSGDPAGARIPEVGGESQASEGADATGTDSER